MNQMAGAMFNLWIISMFYHQMNQMNQMIGDYFFFILSPNETDETDDW